MKKYAYGVDIGGTSIKLGLFESSGNVLYTWEIPTNKKNNGKNILHDISKSIIKKSSQLGVSLHNVQGIGMGVPGPIRDNGTVCKCVNVGWGVFNVAETLENIMNVKVKVGNDANVAALGEYWQGGGKGHQSNVMVTLGTGVGGGIIIDGKILSGFNGAAGEIGHLNMVDNESGYCGCGNKGCLEQYASATGLVRLTKAYLERHPNTTTKINLSENISAKDILDAANDNDEVALIMLDKISTLLSKALAQIACVIDPEVFVIGGGMSKAGNLLLDKIKEKYGLYAFHATRDVQFKLAQLGNDAGIYGGAKLILE